MNGVNLISEIYNIYRVGRKFVYIMKIWYLNFYDLYNQVDFFVVS